MTLIVIGGAEDKEGEMLVHRRVLSEARGENSRVCVVTSATSDPKGARARYEAVYRALDVSDVEFLHIDTAAMANSLEVAQQFAQADVIFMTGGDQNKLCDILRGTRAHDILCMRYNAGGLVVAGTSAGAAAVSHLMLANGEVTPLGLGLAPDTVIDTHFSERNRLSRLFTAVAQHPEKIGIGLDEDTALVIRRNRAAEVVGSGTVTIVDVRQETPAQQVRKLPAGARVDLRKQG